MRQLGLAPHVARWFVLKPSGAYIAPVSDPETRARMPDELPADVKHLLVDSIESYEQLEILLLLRADAHEWTPNRVAAQLGIDVESTRHALDHLVGRDLLERRERAYRYRPRVVGLAEAVAGLAVAYRGERRLQVMRAVNANAMKRVRSSAARLFADAFVLGKGRQDG
jgi:hypothetical protein